MVDDTLKARGRTLELSKFELTPRRRLRFIVAESLSSTRYRLNALFQDLLNSRLHFIALCFTQCFICVPYFLVCVLLCSLHSSVASLHFNV